AVQPARSSKSWLNFPTMHGSRPSRLGSHQEGALWKCLDRVTTHPPWVSNRRLGCCLTLRRIYLMRYEYRFLDSYLFLSSLYLAKFRLLGLFSRSASGPSNHRPDNPCPKYSISPSQSVEAPSVVAFPRYVPPPVAFLNLPVPPVIL